MTGIDVLRYCRLLFVQSLHCAASGHPGPAKSWPFGEKLVISLPERRKRLEPEVRIPGRSKNYKCKFYSDPVYGLLLKLLAGGQGDTYYTQKVIVALQNRIGANGS